MKYIKIILIAFAIILIPSVAFATPVNVNRLNNDHIEPLNAADFFQAVHINASSTTDTSTFNGSILVGDPNSNSLSYDSINGVFRVISGAGGASFRGGGLSVGTSSRPSNVKFSVYGAGATIGSCVDGVALADEGLTVCGFTGLGTSTPGYQLTTQGDINFTGNLYQNGVLFTSGGGSGNAAFTLGNGFIFNATSSDMVGIGSTTPTATLTVQGTTTQGTRKPFVVASSTNAELLTILPNGFVGIGSSTPGSALVVSGNLVLANANVSILSTSNGTGARSLTVKSANSGAGTAGNFDSGSGNSAGLSGAVTSKSGTGNTTGTYDAGSGAAATGASGASTFKAGNAPSAAPGLTTIGGSTGGTGGTTEIINGTGSIGTDGNINIYTGRSNPADGSAGSRGNIRMQTFAIDTHVGIGTTSPIALLAVMASTTGRDPMLSISSSTSTPLQINRDASIGVGWSGVGLVDASSTPYFPTLMSVRAAGLVIDPFSVGSSTNISSTSTPPYFIIKNNGNIGVATNTPARKLTIVGDQQLTGGFADNTNSFGTAGQVLSTNGTVTSWTSTSTLYTKNIATATTAGPTAGIGNTATLTVNCSAGLTLLSGGASIASNANDAVLRDSFPASTTAWTTVYEATLGVGAGGTITGYALCQ